MPELDRAFAQQWVDRWDAQQQRYMPDREERFTALIDAVEAGTGLCGLQQLRAAVRAPVAGAVTWPVR